MIGAEMILTGKWTGAGVFNMEQNDPDPSWTSSIGAASLALRGTHGRQAKY